MNALPLVDTTNAFSPTSDPLPLIVDSDGNSVKDDNHVFTLAGNDTARDAPAVVLFTNFGSAQFTFDLVPANTTFQPTIPINDGNSSSTSQAKRHFQSRMQRGMAKRQARHRQLFGMPASLHRRQAATNETASYGNISAQPWLSRSDSFFGFDSWTGHLGNVTQDPQTMETSPIQDGQYRLLIRFAKLFTDDFSNEANYESYVSHAFTIQQSPASNGATNSTQSSSA